MTPNTATGRRSFGFSERIEKLKALLSHLSSLWREPSLRPPMLRLFVARTLFYLAPGIALFLAAGGRYVTAAVVAVVAILLRGPLLIYDAFQQGRLAHLFAAYSRGTPSNAAGAGRAIDGKGGRLLFVSFLEWMERRLQSKDSEDSGILGALLAAVIGEILDVAGAYLLPAVVIDDVRIKDSVDELRELRDHIPTTLVASVGFDAVTSLLSRFFWGPVTVLFLAVVVGIVTQMVTLGTGLLVLGIAAVLLAAPLAALQALRESAKAVYFTALYMLVAHPDEVSGDREGSLQGLVELEAAGNEESPPAAGGEPEPGGAPA